MKIAVICLCWLLILTAPGVMAQQPTTPNQSTTVPNQSWDLLRQLQAEEKIEVERKAGKKKVLGKFVSLSDTELVIKPRRKNESFSRDEVKNIWRVKPISLKKRVWSSIIGGVIVIVAGNYAGYALHTLGVDEESLMQVIGLFAAMIPVGAVLFNRRASRKGGKRILIYSAP